MRQALHILRKDVRYLRNEIALMLLLALAFAAMHAPALHVSKNSWLLELALVAVAAFLIGQLVLAEAIPAIASSGSPDLIDGKACSAPGSGLSSFS